MILTGHLAGISFRPPEARATLDAAADHEPVNLVAEPSNKYDRNAVQVWVGGQHVGYIGSAKTTPAGLHSNVTFLLAKSNWSNATLVRNRDTGQYRIKIGEE